MFRTTLREAREEGFTLVELLIVIVVLGILAGIVVFGVATFRGDAQNASCNADVKTVQTASDAYYAGKGSYAADIAALVTAKYLKAAPTGSTLAYDKTNGNVTLTSCP